jgi:hypothetical protein
LFRASVFGVFRVFSFWRAFDFTFIGNKFLGKELARVDVAVFIGKVVDFRAAFNVVFGR